MRPAFVIAGKDLKQRFRDRSAIVLGFVAPVAIATLMSVAFRGTEHFHVTIGVVDRDHGALSTAFVDVLQSPDLRGVVTAERIPDQTTASRRVHSGNLAAAIVVPPGFSESVTANRAAQLDVLTSVNTALGGQVALSLARSFVAQVNADRLSLATAIAAGAPQSQVAQLAVAATKLHIPESVAARPIGSRPLKAISYYGPAMAIFFLLFAVGFTSRSFFSERSDGMLDRIAAAPVRAGEILLGKALSVFVYGVASLTTMVVVTTVLFGAYWGSPLQAGALCLVMILAVVALTSLVIAVARTQRQAEGLSSIIVFGLAILGGNFVSISTAPAVMRKIALLTPNGWALRGFVDLTTGASGASVVLQPLLAILAFSVVVGGVAAASAHRIVSR